MQTFFFIGFFPWQVEFCSHLPFYSLRTQAFCGLKVLGTPTTWAQSQAIFPWCPQCYVFWSPCLLTILFWYFRVQYHLEFFSYSSKSGSGYKIMFIVIYPSCMGYNKKIFESMSITIFLDGKVSSNILKNIEKLLPQDWSWSQCLENNYFPFPVE